MPHEHLVDHLTILLVNYRVVQMVRANQRRLVLMSAVNVWQNQVVSQLNGRVIVMMVSRVRVPNRLHNFV